ncbi:hypothetical protein HDU97_009359 [Phlyctochytrium planicorne]|nr:hypothetical protein HDU97_009359 [Phlyctochytrium planicorne]
MGPKRQVVAAMEKKAANEEAKNKKLQEQMEAEEASKWSTGAKSNAKKEDEARKKAEAAAKKAEREALLAAEEKEISSKKPASAGPSKGGKTAAKKTAAVESFGSDAKNVEEYSASGIDAALELLDITEKGTEVKQTKNLVEKHPEKRMKSAWAAFEEREMVILKEENPGLRLSQLKQLLQKKWKKSPENPMNQVTAAYNSTAEELREQVANVREEALERMKVN